jgi:hypothetical protein
MVNATKFQTFPIENFCRNIATKKLEKEFLTCVGQLAIEGVFLMNWFLLSGV